MRYVHITKLKDFKNGKSKESAYCSLLIKEEFSLWGIRKGVGSNLVLHDFLMTESIFEDCILNLYLPGSGRCNLPLHGSPGGPACQPC